MKHSNKIIILELIILVLSFFCFYICNISRNLYLISLIVMTFILSTFLNYEKREERFNIDIFLIIIISILSYYFLTNLMGFYFGFYYSNYSKSIQGIITNVIQCLVVVYSEETVRNILIKNNYYHKSIVYVTPIICLLLELPFLVNFHLLLSNIDIFSALLSIVVPCIIKQIALTYIVYKSNNTCSILYQLLLWIPKYFLPVFPNLGDFYQIVVDVLLPSIVCILVVNITTIKFSKIKESRQLSKKNYILISTYIVLFTIMIVMLYLTSGMFRFNSMAIGSWSMKGEIDKGDIVIIDRKDTNIEKNDIIAFNQGGKVVVHRVVNIEDTGRIIYTTKGDANNDVDPIKVTSDSLVGKVVFKIKWLGWPTVSLSELIRNR